MLTIAIDVAKNRAYYTEKANFSLKKRERHFSNNVDKNQEYLFDLEQNNAQKNNTKITNIQAQIERLNTNKISYEIVQEK
ncbi:hypothetical protein ACRASX_15200 [Flavobacterium sp. TMP13]|uniref:hypothetical protein n=1 Tax=unclassified Flavobacterium TaxID=196869 RepID=UPI0009EB75B1|nr:hypothetical protein [Flavobacterium sp. TAB 87]